MDLYLYTSQSIILEHVTVIRVTRNFTSYLLIKCYVYKNHKILCFFISSSSVRAELGARLSLYKIFMYKS